MRACILFAMRAPRLSAAGGADCVHVLRSAELLDAPSGAPPPRTRVGLARYAEKSARACMAPQGAAAGEPGACSINTGGGALALRQSALDAMGAAFDMIAARRARPHTCSRLRSGPIADNLPEGWNELVSARRRQTHRADRRSALPARAGNFQRRRVGGRPAACRHPAQLRRQRHDPRTGRDARARHAGRAQRHHRAGHRPSGAAGAGAPLPAAGDRAAWRRR